MTKTEVHQDWFFTFGPGQKYPNRYVRIFGTYGSTREEMFDMFGEKWSMQYESEEIIKKHGLTEIDIQALRVNARSW